MRYFEFSDRLGSDSCALAVRNRENVSVQDYHLSRRKVLPDRMMDRAFEIVHEHPNLRIQDGMNADVIDIDSSIRYNEHTNQREKQQMSMRYFHAVPNLARGAHKPDVESELMNAESGTVLKQCSYKLAEVDFQRFTPFVGLVQQNIKGARHVPDFPTIGVDSRDAVRTQMKQAMVAQK